MKSRIETGVRTTLFLALLALGGWAMHAGMFAAVLDRDAFVSALQAGNWQIVPVWVLAGSVFTALGGPRQMLALVAGFAFGGLTGALYSTLVTLLGCLITMGVSRALLADLIVARYPQRVASLQALFAWHGWLSIAMIRFFPVGSNVLTNLLAGAARLGVVSMLAGSFIGYLPQMLVFSFAGAGMGGVGAEQWWLSAALFVVSSIIAVALYRGHLQRQLEQWRNIDEEVVQRG